MVEDWTNLRIRRSLVERIAEFLDTPDGKRTGFTNPTQFVDNAIRELIKESFKKRFEHVNTYEDKVRILDNQIGKTGDIVTIQFKEKSGYCQNCESNTCIHIKYVWEIPEVVKILRTKGLKPISNLH